ncbi:unnamed protein product [Mytilus coruscus]|uniref:Reverse transcriptase domain-containing protein n=1 Tax=Mytilus coruscus TaxID=42192 RepID=A0A6J8CWL9_MYTCO|nr:unnamed protein product [Mytilus coruscus]
MWQSIKSKPVNEFQGVRQGGVWSPTAYKVFFINALLKIFEMNGLGAHFSIYCGISTVADDVTLISNNPYEMQAMLNVLSDYANKHRYIISSQKSCTLQYGSKTEHLFTLNGQPLQNSIKATHLGIDHDVNSKYGVKDCVPSRIQTARKTV